MKELGGSHFWPWVYINTNDKGYEIGLCKNYEWMFFKTVTIMFSKLES